MVARPELRSHQGSIWGQIMSKLTQVGAFTSLKAEGATLALCNRSLSEERLTTWPLPCQGEGVKKARETINQLEVHLP